ncbi:hypothetical protein AB0M28_19250 [Streptomyces sp. NPDC051940]|uniref:hypothetical protein n=1 Tax=Streptomyces sp. NPDC051940 TaxID=3155675 RepID=UPI0034260620
MTSQTPDPYRDDPYGQAPPPGWPPYEEAAQQPGYDPAAYADPYGQSGAYPAAQQQGYPDAYGQSYDETAYLPPTAGQQPGPESYGAPGAGGHDSYGGARGVAEAGRHDSYGGAQGVPGPGQHDSYGGAQGVPGPGQHDSYGGAQGVPHAGEQQSYGGQHGVAQGADPLGQHASYGGAQGVAGAAYGADAAQTAFLPPVTGGPAQPHGQGAGQAQPHAQDGRREEMTTVMPPVPAQQDGPGPQAGGEAPGGGWPDGWERPAGAAGPRRAAPQPAGAPAAAPTPGIPTNESAPTVYGAPTKRRPLPSAAELREQGASEIIAPGPQPAAITAGLALLLAVTAPLARPGLALGVLALQAVTAAGWFRLNGMWPARQGIGLAFAGGLTATVAALFTGREHTPGAVLGALGVWVLLAIVVQMRGTQPGDERLSALTATVAATALAVLGAGYLAAPSGAVVVGALSVATATLVRAIPLPPTTSPLVALFAATGIGAAAGAFTSLGASGALLGLAAGGTALVGLQVASYDYPSRFVHMTAGVALPLTLSVPATYLLGEWLG